MFRVAPPCERWGRVTRCDVWTVLGGFYGGPLGFGLGWLLLDSVPVGLVTAVAGAAILGWRYRVVTSILAAADADAQPAPRLGPERVKGTPTTFALAGAFCGVIVGVTAGTLFDQHGAVLAVETVGASAFLAWQFVQRSNRWRR